MVRFVRNNKSSCPSIVASLPPAQVAEHRVEVPISTSRRRKPVAGCLLAYHQNQVLFIINLGKALQTMTT